jgi:hypothetical protein
VSYSVCAVSFCGTQDSAFAVLDAYAVRRLAQCVRVLTKITRGHLASHKQMQRGLTEEEYEQYRASFNSTVTHYEDEWLNGRPQALDEYTKIIKSGDLYNAMAERLSAAKKKKYDTNGQSASLRMRRKAEAAYERALEYLRSLTDGAHDAAEIERWLDRNVSWVAGEEPSVDAEGVPRVRGSKSKYAQDADRPQWSARDGRLWRQREALTSAVLPLVYEKVVCEKNVNAVPSSKLEQLMRIDVEDDY